ncbi:glycosyltransferase family 4 protein [Niallia sp. 01092]|uniref:glycosyltransferase family 4 protein n=1 Tax=unclassified Niallia TaxID=2837522 RepID=UPI003FCFDAAC
MKIAIVSPGRFSVPPVVGTSVEHVINQVANQLKERNKVIVYTRKCKEYPNSSMEGNLIYKRIKFNHARNYQKKVIRSLYKHQPDVIVIENRPSYVFEIKKAFPTIPVLLNMHSDVFASRRYMKPGKMTEASKIVDGLITNSKALETFFIAKYPAFKGKSFPIHLGIDTLPYENALQNQALISELRKKFGLKNEDPVILFAGRILKKKGVHLLLEILPQLIEKYPTIKLIITGSPKYGKNVSTKYMDKIRWITEELKEHVVFTDFIKPELMPSIYQLADIIVTPSIWNEPFLLVNLEAMAAKKPVISTNKGGIPEVVKHGETGIIFSVENYKKELPLYLRFLLDSPAVRETLSANAFRRAKEFSWSKTAERYLHVFNQLKKKAVF